MRPGNGHESPFERIRRTNTAGGEFWSSREFAQVLGYTDYRNFEQVIQKARLACFNSGQKVEDHFVDVTELIEIGKGGQRAVRTVFLSRYACYLIVQNADPAKDIVALGQTYFAVQITARYDARIGCGKPQIPNLKPQTPNPIPDCPTACSLRLAACGPLCLLAVDSILVS